MSKIKYVSSSGLTHYDEKIKKVIDEVDTSTNTKVTQTPTSTDASYPLLLSPSGQTQETNTTSYFNSGVVLNPSTKTISANITGNAKTATKATSADKLNTNAGSASQPTYFADGVPKACTYSLNKTVPADAVFTDTIAVKSVEDTSIQLTDAKDANMLLNHAPINMLNITCTSQTVNGLTITVNPDKTIYVKGTATKEMYVTVGNFNVTNGQTFSFGQTKRVNGGVGDDGTSWDSYMWFKGYDGTGTWKEDGVYVATVTGTITVELYVKNGATVDCTYYPRVYYENKSHYYVPPEGYTITACGKNLVDVSEISTWDSLNNSEYCQKMLKVKPNTKYTISQLSNRGNYSWLFIMSGRHTDYSANWMSVTINGCLVDKPYTVTSDSEGFITVGSLNTITTDIQIQLEEGDTATDYEPFIGKKVTIYRNTTFPLSGLESYDGLTNVLNPYSATMEVTYATNEAGQGILRKLEAKAEKDGSNATGDWGINITGNAATATKATQDASGNTITSTYAKKSIYGDTVVSMGRKADTTVGENSFAFGNDVTASGYYSHAEGSQTTASATSSHAEGYHTTASATSSHAEGWGVTASGQYSHAEGGFAKASNNYSHAEGYHTTASGNSSHAEGEYTTASNNYSHAEGYYTTALMNQHAQGHYNDTTLAKANSTSGTSDGTAFVIGNGTSDSKSNAFRITGKGVIYATNATVQTGADYAEYFEWSDGNPNKEDRVGYFVTFDEDNPEKIRIASKDDYILGIVSGMPNIIGNGDECWKQRYILDSFGRYIEETFEYEVEVPEAVEKEVEDEETGETKIVEEVVIHKETKIGTKWKENPEYDPTQPYIPRDKRAEWDAIGLLGVLNVVDDGTCQVNGYCKCTDGGIATACEKGEGYRVIKRISDNIVKVVLK